MGIKGSIYALLSKFDSRITALKRRVRLSCLSMARYGVKRHKRNGRQIIVSLTSYEPRLKHLELPLRSLLMQRMKPDRILVWISCDLSLIPPKTRALEKFGIEFRKAPFDAKSHKKYLFSFEEFPDDCIITADDDIIYPSDFVSTLWKAHKNHPDCICARRVHKIRFNLLGGIVPYTEWGWECRSETEPRFDLLPTGGAGALYPPNAVDYRFNDFDLISKLSLTADDIWLKYMALLKGTKTCWAKNKEFPLFSIDDAQKEALGSFNVTKGGNDMCIERLEKEFHDDIELATKGSFYPRKNPILFSIVIPVYNAEKTIGKCLSSVLCQYADDCELILINDGSTDDSAKIISKMTDGIPNVTIINKENEGSNKAYDLGFGLAKGVYVISLDDDDELGAGTIDSSREIAKKQGPDIIHFAKKDVTSLLEGKEWYTAPMLLAGKKEILKAHKSGSIGIRTHSGKAIRRDLMKDLHFSGNPHGADTRFFLKILARSNSIACNPKACWIYHLREQSQSYEMHDVSFHRSWLDNIKDDLDFFESNPIRHNRPFIGIDILFDHYCLWCQASFEENVFSRKEAQKFGLLFWNKRRLFPKGIKREIFKRAFFPETIAKRYANAKR